MIEFLEKLCIKLEKNSWKFSKIISKQKIIKNNFGIKSEREFIETIIETIIVVVETRLQFSDLFKIWLRPYQ